MPFARIASEWSHDNQSVPDHIAPKLRHSRGQNGTVRGFTLDVDWDQVDLAQ